MYDAGYGATRTELTGDIMVFEDSSQAGTSGSRYLGEGFRQEPDFRDITAPTVPVVAGQVVALPETTVALGKRGTPPNLEYVFDDPEDGEPGRDRMLVHGLWELLLAVALAGLGYLLYRSDSSAFSAGGMRTLLMSITVLGLAGTAAALSLRVAAPNLAVGAVSVAAALYFGQHAGAGFVQPLLIVVAIGAGIGAVQGLVIVGLHVPGWAVSLGIALALVAWIGSQAPLTTTGGYDPALDAYWWFAGFAALSVVAALVGLVPQARRAVGRFRPVADPARRRRALAAVITLAGTVGSSMLAAVAGVLSLTLVGAARPSDGVEVTALAVGVALLGGTSAFGRRGGIFGTVLAAAVVGVGLAYAANTQPRWSVAAFAAVAIGLGLAVTRLVERFGRPAPAPLEETDDEWAPRVHSSTPTALPNGWATGTTSRPTTQTTVGGIWASDESWGTTER